MAEATRPNGALPKAPYPGLSSYSASARALFAGRDGDVVRFANLVCDSKTRLVVLHGQSGVGKSSFLQAGLIPFVEEEHADFRFIQRDCPDEQSPLPSFRATKDLVARLAEALWQLSRQKLSDDRSDSAAGRGDEDSETAGAALAEAFQPRLEGEVSVEGLDKALRREPKLLGEFLAIAGLHLPFTPILVIDQCEDVFTLALTEQDAETRTAALECLNHTLDCDGDFRVILSLRTEYMGRLCHKVRHGHEDTTGFRQYLLSELDQEGLLEAILRPTEKSELSHSDEIPLEKYRFSFDDGVAAEIARRTSECGGRQPEGTLLLMQVVCAHLYHRLDPEDDARTIGWAELKAIGNIEDALRSHVERILGGVSKGTDRDAIKRLMSQLILRQTDGALIPSLIATEQVANWWKGRTPFDDFLDMASGVGLLRCDEIAVDGKRQQLVSLGHDALARSLDHWEAGSRRSRALRKIWSFVGSFAALALVTTILAFVGWQQRSQALRNERLATQERDRVRDDVRLAQESVNNLLLHASNDMQLGEPPFLGVRNELLEKAGAYYKQLLAESSDRLTEAERARAHFWFGLSRSERLDADGITRCRARRSALVSFDQALKIQKELLDADPANVTLIADAGRTAVAIGDTWRDLNQQLSDALDSQQSVWNALDRELRNEVTAKSKDGTQLSERLMNAVNRRQTEWNLLGGEVQTLVNDRETPLENRLALFRGKLEDTLRQSAAAAEQGTASAMVIAEHMNKILDNTGAIGAPFHDQLQAFADNSSSAYRQAIQWSESVSTDKAESTLHLLQAAAHENLALVTSRTAARIRDEQFMARIDSAIKALTRAQSIRSQVSISAPRTMREDVHYQLAHGYYNLGATRGRLLTGSGNGNVAKLIQQALHDIRLSLSKLDAVAQRFQHDAEVYLLRIKALRQKAHLLSYSADETAKATAIGALNEAKQRADDFFQSSQLTAASQQQQLIEAALAKLTQ